MKSGGKEETLFLSIIIPVRDESAHITDLLGDLEGQTYAKGNFEVIVVDDNSSDHTPQITSTFLQKSSLDMKIIRMDSEKEGKKRALQAGMGIARGEVIVTTDGDCRVKEGWLCLLNAFFVSKRPVMVTGPVTFHGERSVFEQLQTVEFASLIGTGAASLYYNRPNMCNGANMAFKKEAFEAVNGYEGSWHIPSGDDEFLMQKIAVEYPGKVSFLKGRDAIVTTKAHRKASDFIHQRKRWASKWRLHKNISIRFLAGFIFLYHLSFIIALLLSINGNFSLMLFFCLTAFKIALEFVFLQAVMEFFGKKIQLFYFLLLQIAYPWYVVFFGLISNAGGYKWKGRRVSNLNTVAGR